MAKHPKCPRCDWGKKFMLCLCIINCGKPRCKGK